MVEYVVLFLLDKILPFAQNESNLLRGVGNEVEYVRAELERMTAFLRVADAMEEEDQQLQVWVRQVRDVAYDTEDVLDEFLRRLGHHHGRGFRGYLSKFSSFIKTSKARHEIATEIQSIKSRVKDIADAYQGHILTYNQQLGQIANNGWYDPRGDALLIEVAELVGIDKPKQELIDLLVNGDSTLKVVSVVGMGGLGKSTLSKQVYDDVEVQQHFQNHVWITVSQSFKEEDLLKDLIQQLYTEIRQPVPEELEIMNLQRLKATIKIFLRQSMYLLVLDDVWSTNVWNSVKYALPKSNLGSRVMLTTRMIDVALTSRIESHGHVYHLNPLSAEEAWILFCRKIFLENYCPPHLEEISRRILRRCGGLPLAIVAIIGVLATKDQNRIDEWEMVYRSLGVKLECNNALRSLMIILSLSYNDLPYYIKPCFLYLSVFPEDCRIDIIRLIRLWIAEGFVKVRQGRTLEEVAESYLNELFNRSLIQVAASTSDGRIKKCHIHDMLREIIISKSRDQNLVAITKEQNILCPDKFRCLSVHNTLQYLHSNKTVLRLRSLLVFGAEESLSTLTGPKLFLLVSSCSECWICKVHL